MEYMEYDNIARYGVKIYKKRASLKMSNAFKQLGNVHWIISVIHNVSVKYKNTEIKKCYIWEKCYFCNFCPLN